MGRHEGHACSGSVARASTEVWRIYIYLKVYIFSVRELYIYSIWVSGRCRYLIAIDRSFHGPLPVFTGHYPTRGSG